MLEKIDLEGCQVKKKDLKTGMVVLTRDGSLYRVLLDTKFGDVLMSDDEDGFLNFDDLSEGLTCSPFNVFNVVRVYEPRFPLYVNSSFDIDNYTLLWERKTKKMTVEEVEKKLGYRIEIVSDK